MALSTLLKKMLIGRAFATERSRIKMFGHMDWTLYPSKGFASILQSIGDKLGEDFLFKLGYENGVMNGKDMIKAMGVKPKGGWLTQKAIVDLLDFLGYGKLDFVVFKSEKNGYHHIILHHIENPMIEHAARLYGKKSKVCSFFRGLFTGHGEVELGIKNPHLKETKCVCKGARYCEFETKYEPKKR
jgi:predicted hydrocarbon binding protein